MPGDTSSKAKRALSRVQGRLLHTKSYSFWVSQGMSRQRCCLSRGESAVSRMTFGGQPALLNRRHYRGATINSLPRFPATREDVLLDRHTRQKTLCDRVRQGLRVREHGRSHAVCTLSFSQRRCTGWCFRTAVQNILGTVTTDFFTSMLFSEHYRS